MCITDYLYILCYIAFILTNQERICNMENDGTTLDDISISSIEEDELNFTSKEEYKLFLKQKFKNGWKKRLDKLNKNKNIGNENTMKITEINCVKRATTTNDVSHNVSLLEPDSTNKLENMKEMECGDRKFSSIGNPKFSCNELKQQKQYGALVSKKTVLRQSPRIKPSRVSRNNKLENSTLVSKSFNKIFEDLERTSEEESGNGDDYTFQMNSNENSSTSSIDNKSILAI